MENEFITIQKKQKNSRQLCDMWTLWAHLPHDTNWDFESYINITSFNNLEDCINLVETISSNDRLVKECMLFFMKNNIKPLWEDEQNKNGSCFSYKLNTKIVINAWRLLIYSIIGNNISNDTNFYKSISGISISPKKNFCILKIWLNNCNYQNPSIINIKPFKNDYYGLVKENCIYKKHI